MTNDVVVYEGEFLPAGYEPEWGTVPKGNAESLVAEALVIARDVTGAVVDARARIGLLLDTAQGRLYTEITGNKISDERNSRRKQIAGISKEWCALLETIAIRENKKVKFISEWASRQLQWYTDPLAAKKRLASAHIAQKISQTGHSDHSEHIEYTEEDKKTVEIWTGKHKAHAALVDACQRAGNEIRALSFKLADDNKRRASAYSILLATIKELKAL